MFIFFYSENLFLSAVLGGKIVMHISKKRKSMVDGIFELNEFLSHELAEHDYSGVEV